MTSWLIRCFVFLAVAAGIAAADSALRPLPPKVIKPEPKIIASGEPAPEPETAMTVKRAAELYNGGAFFLDARLLSSYTTAHVDGAFHLDPASFRSGRPDVLDILPTDLPLVIYCDGGDCESSHMVERMLHSHGFTNTMVFEPGFPAWEGAGLPTASGPPEI